MRLYKMYGFDEDGITYPHYENFCFRAVKIFPDLNLCEYCLLSNKHCIERTYKRQRNWKKYRRTQWKPKPII